MKTIDFSKITLREKVTSRGGGIEIDLTSLGFPDERMAAYQNYLGGGMLGRVMVNDTIQRQAQTNLYPSDIKRQLQYSGQLEELDQIGEQLKRYYHCLTNPDEGNYEQNQNMPESGY